MGCQRLVVWALALRGSSVFATAASWRDAPSLPSPLMGMEGGTYKGDLITVGGFDGTQISHDLLRFPEGGDHWVVEGAAPAEGVGSDDSGSVILNGVLYLLGGISKDPVSGSIRNVSSMMGYDIEQKTWSTKASMPAAKRGFSVAADDAAGRLYAAGGINCKANCYAEDVAYLSTLDMYDANTDEWTRLPPMPHARRDLAVAMVNGYLFVAGGCSNPSGSSTHCYAMNHVDMYDTRTGKWSAAPPLASPRHGFALGICPTSKGTAVLAFGGSSEPGIMNNPTPLASTEVMVVQQDGSASPWREVGSLQVPRYGLLKGYGLNIDGDVYAVGGSTLHPGQLNPSRHVEKISCAEVMQTAEIVIV